MRILVLIAAAMIATPVRADVSDSGNLQIGGEGVIAGTMTVQGNAFSVGGSTFSVLAGTVNVGGLLKVSAAGIQWNDGKVSTTSVSGGGGGVGDAVLTSSQTFSGANVFTSSTQFGTGASRSTFTAYPGGSTYALQLSSGVTIAGGGPVNLTSGGFIRFADGTISTTAASGGGGGGSVVLSATQTWTGANTFTSSLTASNFVLPAGSTSTTGGRFHRSTFTFNFGSYVQGTNTSISTCNIPGSYIQIQLDTAGDVVATFSGSVSGTNVQYIGAMLDWTSPGNSSAGISAQNAGRGIGYNDVAAVQFYWTNVSSGTHTLCMAMGTNAGTWNLDEGRLFRAEVLK